MIPINTTDTEIISEALNVLYKNMTHSKVVRFLSMVRIGEGDYLKIKQDLFKEETVGSLIKKRLKPLNFKMEIKKKFKSIVVVPPVKADIKIAWLNDSLLRYLKKEKYPGIKEIETQVQSVDISGEIIKAFVYGEAFLPDESNDSIKVLIEGNVEVDSKSKEIIHEQLRYDEI